MISFYAHHTACWSGNSLDQPFNSDSQTMRTVCVQRTKPLLSSRPFYEGKLVRDLFLQVLLYLTTIWIVMTLSILHSSQLWPKFRGKLTKNGTRLDQ